MEVQDLPKTEKLSGLDKKILHDFYLSFRMSQGMPSTQYNILLFAAKNYPLSSQEDIDQLVNRLKPEVDKLNIPQKEHKTKVTNEQTGTVTMLDFQQAQHSQQGFQSQWEFFVTLMEQVVTKPGPSRLTSINRMRARELSEMGDNELIAHTLLKILRSDIDYQKNGRPERMPGSDVYESFLRTHMVEGKRTGSETYDKLYKKMGELIENLDFESIKEGKQIDENKVLQIGGNLGLSYTLVDELGKTTLDLVRAWERNHVGKKFFDELPHGK